MEESQDGDFECPLAFIKMAKLLHALPLDQTSGGKTLLV
jgi:hypothetical protein